MKYLVAIILEFVRIYRWPLKTAVWICLVAFGWLLFAESLLFSEVVMRMMIGE